MNVMIAVYFTLLAGLANTHQREGRNFRGLSKGFGLTLNLSGIAGGITTLGLAVWSGFVLAWYWPIVLIVVGGVVGGILFASLDSTLGGLGMKFLGFLWPVPAYLMFRALSAASVVA